MRSELRARTGRIMRKVERSGVLCLKRRSLRAWKVGGQDIWL